MSVDSRYVETCRPHFYRRGRYRGIITNHGKGAIFRCVVVYCGLSQARYKRRTGVSAATSKSREMPKGSRSALCQEI